MAPRVEELLKHHHTHDAVYYAHDRPFLWAISDALWYDLMAIKREFLEFFRGSVIGDWRV